MKKISFALCFMILLIACEQTPKAVIDAQKVSKYKSKSKHKNTGQYKLESTGSLDEILTIITEKHWRGAVGEELRNVLMADYNIIPQKEPLFDLRQVPGGSLVGILKRTSSVLIVGTLDEDNPTTELLKNSLNRLNVERKPPYFKRINVWAQPQSITYLYGDNEQDLIAKIKLYKDKLIGTLYELENEKALNNVYVPGISNGLSTMVRDRLNISLGIPNNFQEVKTEEDNFIWLRRDNQAAEEIINILLYSRPYEDGKPPELSEDFIIGMRNELGKSVESQIKGSHMVSDPVIPFSHKTLTLDSGTPAVEVRGLWRLKGDFMGGPFLTYVINDNKRKRTLLLDGFIYSPKSKKRLHVRRMEVLLKTVTLQ